MPALEDRIGKDWGALQKKKYILTSRNISIKTKRQTYETYILMVVSYATETMVGTKQMIKKIKVVNNHMMCWMCGAKLRDKQSILKGYFSKKRYWGHFQCQFWFSCRFLSHFPVISREFNTKFQSLSFFVTILMRNCSLRR